MEHRLKIVHQMHTYNDGCDVCENVFIAIKRKYIKQSNSQIRCRYEVEMIYDTFRNWEVCCLGGQSHINGNYHLDAMFPYVLLLHYVL